MVTVDLAKRVGDFFSLTPDNVLDAVEESGHCTTGLCYPLNSLENRVYEVEVDGGARVVAKFYRPGRWSRQTILDEHCMLAALAAQEIPVCAPVPFPDGRTLHENADGIYLALFPRTGGRAPEEIDLGELEQIGRLLARIHNVSTTLNLEHRPEISPATYGRDSLNTILERVEMPAGLRARYVDCVERLIDIAEPWFEGVEALVVHGDCHRGNLLRGGQGWFFLDFDDMGWSPPVQDVWLLLPGRHAACEAELNALLAGYEQFREFDHGSLRLIEVLRGLRYVRYAAWVASRWDDPSFKRAFPGWGNEAYWEEQTADLRDQLELIADSGAGGP